MSYLGELTVGVEIANGLAGWLQVTLGPVWNFSPFFFFPPADASCGGSIYIAFARSR